MGIRSQRSSIGLIKRLFDRLSRESASDEVNNSMRNWMPAGLFGFLWFVLGQVATALAVEPLHTLDMVSADAAFCLEIPHLDEHWKALEASPLMERLQAFPLYQQLQGEKLFQAWRGFEDYVAKEPGESLSVQMRSLFAKSLVLAMYVSPDGVARGILIGEADDAASIKKFKETWQKLEPKQITITKSYPGNNRYFQIKKHPDAKDSVFLAHSKRYFAISNHESLIHRVIDRFVATTNNPPSAIPDSLRRRHLFAKDRERLRKDGVAYVYVSGRPWDRSLEESSRGTEEAYNPATIWKHVDAISGCLHIEQGIVCDTIIELEKNSLPRGWPQFVETASGKSSWQGRIPPEAILAINGHLELAPILRTALSQIHPKDLAELAKTRRIVQSFFGGHDLFDNVLPALARDFSGFVKTRTDAQQRIGLDGMFSFTLDASADNRLALDINRGLEMALSVLAAYFSFEGKDVVTVNGEQTDTTHLRWLSDTAPYPLAYGMKGRNLVIAGSQDCLRQSLESQTTNSSSTRLLDHANRFFPDANQLLWVDTAQVRQLWKQHGSDLTNLFRLYSSKEARELEAHVKQSCPILELIDSFFVAGRIEADHILITIGGGVDAK